MRAILIILFLIILSFQMNAQSWNWALSAGNTGPDFTISGTIDQNDNYYLVVNSWGGVGTPIFFKNYTFVMNGETDFFLAKYDVNGNEIWVKQFGGPFQHGPNFPDFGWDAITGIEFVPLKQNLIISGTFTGSCVFGNYTVTASDYGDQNTFLAGFDLNGNCLWVRQFGGGGQDQSNSVSVDPLGFIYACMMFPYSGTFGDTLVTYGGYLSKFDIGGNLIWLKKIFSNANPGTNFPIFITRSEFTGNELYLLGYNIAQNFVIDTITVSLPGYSGHLIAQFNPDGLIKWIKCLGGPNRAGSLFELGADQETNIYMTGYFSGPYATFDSDTIHSNASNEMYVLKLSSSGELVWIKQANASQKAQGYGICTGTDGSLYISGEFTGVIQMDEVQLTSASGSVRDTYILKLDQNGNALQGVQATGGVGLSLHQTSSGALNLAGSFLNVATFGNYSFIELGSGGWGDVFLAQHDPITSHIAVNQREVSGLLIFANPTTGLCSITIPEELQNEDNLSLLVYDHFGKLILKETISINESSISLNLEAHAKGMYNAILTDGKRSFQGKIVFE